MILLSAIVYCLGGMPVADGQKSIYSQVVQHPDPNNGYEDYLRGAFRSATSVDAGAIAQACERPELISQRIRAAQLDAIERWKKEQPSVQA